jgi:hypothetical protein
MSKNSARVAFSFLILVRLTAHVADCMRVPRDGAFTFQSK